MIITEVPACSWISVNTSIHNSVYIFPRGSISRAELPANDTSAAFVYDFVEQCNIALETTKNIMGPNSI